MLTLLRSNQPIAWLVVPITLIVLLGGAIHWGGWTAWQAGMWGMQALVIAGLGHLLYRSFEYSERADPALSWLLTGLLFACEAMAPTEVRGADWRSWASLASGLWSMWWMQGVFRQARVSGLTFRAGALAGIAWWLEPSSLGVVIGAAVVLAKTRTFLLREWLLFLLGAAWIPATAQVLSWNGWDLPAIGHRLWNRPTAEVLTWSTAAAGLTVAGWAVATLATRSASIRRKASRLNLPILTVIPATWSILTDPSNPLGWRLAAVAIAFSWVWLVPTADRKARFERWVRVGLWACTLGIWLVGIALALLPH